MLTRKIHIHRRFDHCAHLKRKSKAHGVVFWGEPPPPCWLLYGGRVEDGGAGLWLAGGTAPREWTGGERVLLSLDWLRESARSRRL